MYYIKGEEDILYQIIPECLNYINIPGCFNYINNSSNNLNNLEYKKNHYIYSIIKFNYKTKN